MGMHAIDLTGQRFGRLVAVRRVEQPANIANGHAWWEFRCDCGNTYIASNHNMKTGRTKSCGCLRAEKCREIGKKNKGRENTWLKK